jgi:hypothetical protein
VTGGNPVLPSVNTTYNQISGPSVLADSYSPDYDKILNDDKDALDRLAVQLQKEKEKVTAIEDFYRSIDDSLPEGMTRNSVLMGVEKTDENTLRTNGIPGTDAKLKKLADILEDSDLAQWLSCFSTEAELPEGVLADPDVLGRNAVSANSDGKEIAFSNENVFRSANSMNTNTSNSDLEYSNVVEVDDKTDESQNDIVVIDGQPDSGAEVVVVDNQTDNQTDNQVADDSTDDGLDKESVNTDSDEMVAGNIASSPVEGNGDSSEIVVSKEEDKNQEESADEVSGVQGADTETLKEEGNNQEESVDEISGVQGTDTETLKEEETKTETGIENVSENNNENENESKTDDITVTGETYSNNEVSVVEITEWSPLSNGVLRTSNVSGELDYQLQKQNRKIAEIEKNMNEINEEIHELESRKSESSVVRVFNPNDVTIPSNITVEEAELALKGTYLEYLAPTFVECEREFGVNAIFLMSIAAHESNWGRSRRAVQDHNYTGFGVYSKSAVGINTATGEENIRMTANHLATNYLNPSGKYYHGVSVRAVHTMYCATGGWTEGIVANGSRLIWKVIDTDKAVVGPSSLVSNDVTVSAPGITIDTNENTVSYRN